MADENRQERGFRDFLYVDTDRVRGLLAQLEGGVVNNVVERLSDSSSDKFGGKLLGLHGSREKMIEGGVEWTRSMEDALFALFEEAAQVSGLLRETPEIERLSTWESGEAQTLLVPGQLVRISGATQILDPPHVKQELLRALEAVQAFAEFEEATDPTPMPAPTGPSGRTKGKLKPKELEDQHESVIHLRMKRVLGMPVVAAASAGVILEKLLGGSITLRVFPCGYEHAGYAMSGPLSDRPGYFRDDRATLFAKYGWEPRLDSSRPSSERPR